MSTERIRSLDCWTGAITVEPISGGITNRNYLVRDGDRACVARLCQQLNYLGIDRRNERVCQQAACAAGVSPDIVHFEDGVLVSQYVDAKTLSETDVCDSAMLDRLAATLRQLHSARDNLVGEMLYFCPFQTVRTYTANARQFGARLPDDIDELIDDSRQLSGELTAFRPTLCHNDLLAANILDDGEDLWLVDWEYAGIGNPLFDLASISANCQLTDELETALLEAYFQPMPEHRLLEVRILKTVSRLREALWAVIQTVKSDLDFDYAKYAANNFAAYKVARQQLNESS